MTLLATMLLTLYLYVNFFSVQTKNSLCKCTQDGGCTRPESLGTLFLLWMHLFTAHTRKRGEITLTLLGWTSINVIIITLRLQLWTTDAFA